MTETPNLIRPNTLQFQKSSFPYGTDGIKVHNGFIYGYRGSGVNIQEIVIQEPSDYEWVEFYNKILPLGIQDWKEKYLNLDVHDGQQWFLKIQMGKIHRTVYGDNDYPNPIEICGIVVEPYDLLLQSLDELSIGFIQ